MHRISATNGGADQEHVDLHVAQLQQEANIVEQAVKLGAVRGINTRLRSLIHRQETEERTTH